MTKEIIPNFSVSEFISKYGKTFRSETDNYEVGPFQKSFDHASKTSKIYNMHTYWVKQDPYIVKQFIEHYTEMGDIVIDAFSGTGMTGVAAILCDRNALLVDISPVCIHMSSNYTTTVDSQVLEEHYKKLLADMEPELINLYRTKCHNCGNSEAQIANTILSDVYRCPRCSQDNLFAGNGRWDHMKKGEKIEQIKCHSCDYQFKKNNADFVRVEPIELRIDCPVCKAKGEEKARALSVEDWRSYIQIEGGPTKVIHEGSDDWEGYDFVPVDKYTDEIGTNALRQLLKESGLRYILPRDIPYWYPKDAKFFGQEPKRNFKRGITHPFQMFSRRNLIALSTLWHYANQINDLPVKEKFRFVFTSQVFGSSRQSKWLANEAGIGAIRMNTLYIPAIIRELNVLNFFKNKYVRLVTGIKEIKGKTQVLCTRGSALNLESVTDNSIDYAFYDPPYGANINYSELNMMWEAWLGQYTDQSKEIIENKAQNKSRNDYEEMMTLALKETYRVLKPGRWLSLVYSYTDPSMYRSVQLMASRAGFVQEGEVLHIGSSTKTKSQLDSDKTQQRYLVINFRKPMKIQQSSDVDKTNIEYEVISVIQNFLVEHGGHNRDRIYDEVIKRLFSTVQIEKFDLDNILKNFFRKVGEKWFAPGTLLTQQSKATKRGQIRMTIEYGDPEEGTIIKLQDFLKKHGTVPLSELREYYLRSIPPEWQDKIDFDIASEGFISRNGKIRLPTEEEATIKQNVATRYQQTQIRRYLNGEIIYSPEMSELCDWIEFCYNHEMYSEAVRLFQMISTTQVDEDQWKRTKRIADACSLKLS